MVVTGHLSCPSGAGSGRSEGAPTTRSPSAALEMRLGGWGVGERERRKEGHLSTAAPTSRRLHPASRRGERRGGRRGLGEGRRKKGVEGGGGEMTKEGGRSRRRASGQAGGCISGEEKWKAGLGGGDARSRERLTE